MVVRPSLDEDLIYPNYMFLIMNNNGYNYLKQARLSNGLGPYLPFESICILI